MCEHKKISFSFIHIIILFAYYFICYFIADDIRHEKIDNYNTSMLQSEKSNNSIILRSESSTNTSFRHEISGDTFHERNAKMSYSRDCIAGKCEWAMLYYQQGPPKEDLHFKSWWRKKKKYVTKIRGQEYIKHEFTETEKISFKRRFNKFEKVNLTILVQIL